MREDVFVFRGLKHFSTFATNAMHNRRLPADPIRMTSPEPVLKTGSRRMLRFFPATVLSAALITCAVSASAQSFPTRPVRMIVPFVAGGGADVTARRLAEQLGAAWKQPVVIQNSGGAGGNVAVAAAASSEPTGYTVLFASVAIIANNPALYEKLPFDVDKDLAPVILLGEVPLVLMVSATLPVSDVPSFIALARKQPGTLHFGSGGIGTSMHLTGELLKSVAGIDLVHVPFKGANQVIAAILGNEIQFIFQNAALVEGQVKGAGQGAGDREPKTSRNASRPADVRRERRAEFSRRHLVRNLRPIGHAGFGNLDAQSRYSGSARRSGLQKADDRSRLRACRRHPKAAGRVRSDRTPQMGSDHSQARDQRRFMKILKAAA
jgi:hypothetical protein